MAVASGIGALLRLPGDAVIVGIGLVYGISANSRKDGTDYNAASPKAEVTRKTMVQSAIARL